MNRLVYITVILLSVGVLNNCFADEEIQMFNARVLRQSVGNPVKLLMGNNPQGIKPSTISLDLKKGEYVGTIIIYPSVVTLQDARKSLNKIYSKYELSSFRNNAQMGLWRNEDDKFVIQLSKEKGCVQIIYRPISAVLEDNERGGKPE